MISGGMFEYWHRHEFQKIKNLKASKKKVDQSDSSSNKNDDTIKPLTNVHLESAYYFFFIGVCVSILSIFIEVILFFINHLIANQI